MSLKLVQDIVTDRVRKGIYMHEDLDASMHCTAASEHKLGYL